jgi:inhibitor of cysteine peptidase
MSEITLTQNDRGGSFEASPGDEVLIRLEENPTTGYRWALDEVDERVLDPTDTDYSMSGEAGIGGGGVRTFAFTARSPGTTRVRLQLRQEWDPENPEDDFEATVTVRD